MRCPESNLQRRSRSLSHLWLPSSGSGRTETVQWGRQAFLLLITPLPLVSRMMQRNVTTGRPHSQ